MSEEIAETCTADSRQEVHTPRLRSPLRHLGGDRREETERELQTILEQDPCHAEALYRQGLLVGQKGELEPAIELINAAITQDPSKSDYYFDLGEIYLRSDHLREAVECYRQALTLKPDHYAAYNGLGNALAKLDLIEIAAEAYQMAVTFQPTFAAAHFNLGRVSIKLNKLDDSVAYYRKAIQLDHHDHPESSVQASDYFEIAKKLESAGRADEALEFYQHALQLDPHHTKANWNLGNIYYQRSTLPKAIEYYRAAQEGAAENPYLHTNLGLALLSAGQYYEGWVEYEWRLKVPEYPKKYRESGSPQWQGEDIAGSTILLHAEQGFGDTLQFVRYIPLVAQMGGRILLEAQPTLCKLLRQMSGVEQAIPAGSPLPEFSRYCSLMSLPYIFGTTIETIPSTGAYLRVAPQEIRAIREQWPGERLRVGIAWSGNPENPVHSYRSMHLQQLAALAKVEGVSFYSLQVGEASKQINAVQSSFSIADVCSGYTDFFDTAGFIAGLDLVITVDTSIAHLAGALGIPVWILLTKNWTDWRWLHNRNTSPWYPSARLFRQYYSGDWLSLMEAVSFELDQFASNHRNQSSFGIGTSSIG